jgi:tetratricopeptide (TPR) repeat protein
MNPDRLAELEEERAFLLRSLGDLEREHAAGDVDEVDYRELKDGYTVRAADTLRAIDAGRSALPAKPPANWTRRLVSTAVVLVLIGLVWWALVASSAERKAGQTPSGLDPRDQREVLMAQARALQIDEPEQASKLYAEVLDTDPGDVEALTYLGWTLAIAAQTERDTLDDADFETQIQNALGALSAATSEDPTYADPKCFLGIVYFRFLGDAESAEPWVDECLAGGPPSDVRGAVESLQAEIAAALAGESSTG